MPDAGLERIARLLDTPSETVASASQQMVAGFSQKDGDQDFRVRRDGFEGLQELRSHYRSLARTASRVRTDKPSLRDDMVDALRAYSASLADFEKALRDKSNNRVKLLKQAAKRNKAAAIDLAKARDRI